LSNLIFAKTSNCQQVFDPLQQSNDLACGHGELPETTFDKGVDVDRKMSVINLCIKTNRAIAAPQFMLDADRY